MKKFLIALGLAAAAIASTAPAEAQRYDGRGRYDHRYDRHDRGRHHGRDWRDARRYGYRDRHHGHHYYGNPHRGGRYDRGYYGR